MIPQSRGWDERKEDTVEGENGTEATIYHLSQESLRNEDPPAATPQISTPPWICDANKPLWYLLSFTGSLWWLQLPCLFLYFWLHWIFTVGCRLFAAVRRILLLWCMGSLLAVLGLSCPMACKIIVPWLGMEPVSPALEGEFFFVTTGLPQKSLACLF